MLLLARTKWDMRVHIRGLWCPLIISNELVAYREFLAKLNLAWWKEFSLNRSWIAERILFFSRPWIYERYLIKWKLDWWKDCLVPLGNTTILDSYMNYFVVVSVLLLGRFLASIFSTLSCFPPFSSVPHMTILSETRSAYPIISFPLVFFLSSDLYHLPQQAFASEYMTDPIFLPSPDHLHKTSFFLYHL